MGLLPSCIADQDIQTAKPSIARATSSPQNFSSCRSPGITTPTRPSDLIRSITSFASGSSVGK